MISFKNYLETINEANYESYSRKVLKQELKKQWKNVKFKVDGDFKNTIVSYKDGPTEKQVEKFYYNLANDGAFKSEDDPPNEIGCEDLTIRREYSDQKKLLTKLCNLATKNGKNFNNPALPSKIIVLEKLFDDSLVYYKRYFEDNFIEFKPSVKDFVEKLLNGDLHLSFPVKYILSHTDLSEI